MRRRLRLAWRLGLARGLGAGGRPPRESPRRDLAALLGLIGALLWFMGPAPRLASSLRDAHAREVRFARLHELVRAVVIVAARDPDVLPSGPEAAACVEEITAIQVHLEDQEAWVYHALTALDSAQLTSVQRATALPQLPRSHAHPAVPPELLRIAELTAETHGSSGTMALDGRSSAPMGMGAETLVRGLRAVIEADPRALRPDQARTIHGAVLAGIHAHMDAPVRLERLALLLGPEVTEAAETLDQVARDDEVLRQYGPLALAVLRAR